MQKFTFHVVSLPHTQTTAEYTHCAYTQKVRKFCNMMTDLGHDVYLYASEENEARVKELVTVITQQTQRKLLGDQDHKKSFFNIVYNAKEPAWAWMNQRVIHEMSTRIKPRDFICLIGGDCQKPIADAFEQNMSVEYGIGYTGTFAKFRVFESYAHMHYVYGTSHNDNGNFYNTVIPNYYDVEEFPFSQKPPEDPYFLFVGRLIDRKGYQIAQQVCEHLGKRLILAGQLGADGFSGYGEHIGVIGTRERGKLMSQASAVFVPTTYLEPFGGVHAEAMLCGTPVITTNFGVFTETVIDGENGFRCNTFKEFIEAAKKCENMSAYQRKKIRAMTQRKFSTEVVGPQYIEYFQRLYGLWDKGWYSI